MTVSDDRAATILEAVMALAIAVRDEGPDAVSKALARVEKVSAKHPGAALVIAAAVIDVGRPVNAWWQQGLAGVGADVQLLDIPVEAGRDKPLQPCGTPAAARRHERNHEPVCDICKAAERARLVGYNARRRVNRAAAAETDKPARHLSVAS